MTEKEIRDKLGAMHFRMLDDPENYAEICELLFEYLINGDYGNDVINALEDGLQNYERYLEIDNALSPRSIIISKKSKQPSKADAEGCYQVAFVLDNGTTLHPKFKRKQSQLLYILMLLFSQKKGLLADFFLEKDEMASPILKATVNLIKLIYPHTSDKAALLMAKDLSPDSSFTDSLQNMKSPILDCVYKNKHLDDLYWYTPYAIKQKKKILYRMHMPQVNIIYPPEFQPIIDQLPDAVEYLKNIGVEFNLPQTDMTNDFAYYKKLADEGDVDGIYYTGCYYGTGDVVSQDYKKAIEYFKLAASKGHVDAIFQLGICYMFGFGIRKNMKKSLSYFEQAANQGHAEAATYAAQCYERGTNGVKVDPKKSFELYKIAADQDVEEGIWYVIDGYLYGHGTEQNPEKAKEWFERARLLGYTKVCVLYGVHLFNQGDDESLDEALALFIDGVNDKVPLAYFMMAKMAIKGFTRTGDDVAEAIEWLTQGADLGDRSCIDMIKDIKPELYKEHKDEWEDTSWYDEFINKVMLMKHQKQERFIHLVDAYRERLRESYVAEICKQLNIHKPKDGDDDDDFYDESRRRIVVRKAQKGKLSYEIVLILANGEEIVIRKFNVNALVLYLLTIICSYKSGYTTKMAKDPACRPILKQLVQMVLDKPGVNLDDYIDGYMYYEHDKEMKKNEDYYKQYSNIAKQTIKAAVGNSDEAFIYLFENIPTAGRQNLRRTILNTDCIELPEELMGLTRMMSDAIDVLKQADNQAFASNTME